MNFEIVGDIEQVETIATGRGVKIRARRVELHWYDAHGIGRRDFKIKRYLD